MPPIPFVPRRYKVATMLRTATARRVLCLLCGPLASCAFDPVALGDDPADGEKLSAHAATAHLAAALSGGDRTFAELINTGADLAFDSAPDPSDLLRSMAAQDDGRSRQNKVALRVLDWNVALLDANIFAVIPYAQTPDLETRRRALPGLVLSTHADVVCLQEVWRPEDVDRFVRAAQGAGYLAFHNDRGPSNDGLLTLVNSSILAPGDVPQMHGGPYVSQDGLEFFPGPGIKRGYLAVAFTHNSAGPIRVYNTHMQAFPENWLGRTKQARELGIDARESGPLTDLLIVAGDLNSGPYYKDARWDAPDGSTFEGWFHNTISYPTLLAYADLVDAAVLPRSQEAADSDVVLGNTVVNDAGKSATVPGSAEGWCDQTPAGTFSATDCNTLYFSQYGGTEYPARIDHIHVRDRGDVVVTHSAQLFDTPRSFGSTVTEPSDHAAVVADLLVDAQ